MQMGGKREEKANKLLTAYNNNLPCIIAFYIFWKLRQKLCPYSLDQWSGTETVVAPSDGAVVL